VAVSFNGLSEDTEELMRLFGEVIQQPAFPQDKLELRRSQLLDRLEHKNDDLGAISRRELSKVLAHGCSARLHSPSCILSSMKIDRPSSQLMDRSFHLQIGLAARCAHSRTR
jgi:predicted Zn-dependent peptidase